MGKRSKYVPVALVIYNEADKFFDKDCAIISTDSEESGWAIRAAFAKAGISWTEVGTRPDSPGGNWYPTIRVDVDEGVTRHQAMRIVRNVLADGGVTEVTGLRVRSGP